MTSVQFESTYTEHPVEDKVLDLLEKINRTSTPPTDKYETVEYVETKAVNVHTIQKAGKENVGRFRGVTTTSYETIERSMDKGYKDGERPACILQGEDWLLNGNHRLKWYRKNGYNWMPVDVFRPVQGVSIGDLIDEVGLLYQPTPEGTGSSYEDYKARGILFVERKKNEGFVISQELVNAWVDKFARNEIAKTRTNLKKAIFNNTTKSAWLIAGDRQQVIDELLLTRGWIVRNADYKIVKTDGYLYTVDRLFEASQKVFLRDFLPRFLKDAKNGVKTRLHFYVTTTNVKDGAALKKTVQTRIAEIMDVLSDMEEFNIGNKRYRHFLELGYRQAQVKDVDGSELVKL